MRQDPSPAEKLLSVRTESTSVLRTKQVATRRSSPFALVALVVIGLGVTVTPAAAAPPQDEQAERDKREFRDLSKLSLEALLEIDIVSASKREQRLSDTPAAVYVITQQDIQRSGLTTIPEVLRMAAGLEVARIDANKWAITSRGFNNRFANKMLVLLDGRSVYTLTFAGTHWDMMDTMLEDIDRIEIIRGPGASIWGANAVNGIINVVTKSAEETQGGLFSTGFGTEEEGFGAFRFGGSMGADDHYRVYGKYFSRDAFAASDGGPAGDKWNGFRGGFRMDANLGEQNQLMVQGEAADYDVNETSFLRTPTPPFLNTVLDSKKIRSGHVLARWSRNQSGAHRTSLQFSFDRTSRDEIRLNEDRDNVDLDFQHDFSMGEHHELIWGLGYRSMGDNFVTTFDIGVDPASERNQVFSAFVQDGITWADGAASLTLGTKVEHNDFTGVEIQPSVRARWKTTESTTLWTAVSRAVRTPSRAEAGVQYVGAVIPGPTGLPIAATTTGNTEFSSESVLAYEAGFRISPSRGPALDIAAFYNDYESLSAFEARSPVFRPSPAPHLRLPLLYVNGDGAQTYGVEIASEWNAAERWKLSGWYSLFRFQGDLDDSTSPEHQAHLRSYLDLPGSLAADFSVRYVGALADLSAESHLRLDTRLSWRVSKNFQATVVFQDLLDSEHLEYVDGLGASSLIERSVYGKLDWRF